MTRKMILSFIFLSITCVHLIAQGSDDALIDRANKFFELAKNYEAALPLYQQAVDHGVTDPLVQYRLGVCYTYAPSLNDQYKGIPYLKYALSKKEGSEIPDEVYYYLGQMYHKDIQISEAIASYEKYKKTLNSNQKKELQDVEHQLKICNNALFLLNQKKGIVINSFDEINSEGIEIQSTGDSRRKHARLYRCS